MVSLERENSLDPVIDESRIKELQDESIRVQGKTFTKWVNFHLANDGAGMVDLFVDIRDGVRLFRLLEILSGDSLGKPKQARSRFHMIDNVNMCLDYLRTKIRIESIGANDIVSGNERLILGLIWTVIKCFQLQGVVGSEESNGGGTEKDHLLFWCQKQLDGYAGIQVQDFSTSWRDGLAFNALVHSHRPDLVDLSTLKPGNHIENLTNAFEIASKHLNIVKLLDPEDVDKDKPDEISIITYISLFYIAIAKSGLRPSRRSTDISSVRPTTLATSGQSPTSPTGSKSPVPQVAPRQKRFSSSSLLSPTSPTGTFPPTSPRGFTPSPRSPTSTGSVNLAKAASRSGDGSGTAPETPRGKASEASQLTVVTGSQRIVADLLESNQVLIYDNSQLSGAWECSYCTFVNVPFTQLCAICFQSKKVVDQLNRKRVVTEMVMPINTVSSSAISTTSSSATSTSTSTSTKSSTGADGAVTSMTTTITRVTRSTVQDQTKQLLAETDSTEKQKVAVDRLGKLLSKMKQVEPPIQPVVPPQPLPPAAVSSIWECSNCLFSNVPHTRTCAQCFEPRGSDTLGQGTVAELVELAPAVVMTKEVHKHQVEKGDHDDSKSESSESENESKDS